jgi:hypothetical protein
LVDLAGRTRKKKIRATIYPETRRSHSLCKLMKAGDRVCLGTPILSGKNNREEKGRANRPFQTSQILKIQIKKLCLVFKTKAF